MNLKGVCVIVLMILAGQSLFAQKYELGEVTIEELKETRHPIDSSASAAILFKTGETKFNLMNDGNWTVSTEVRYKIKIYKKEGLDYANKSKSYYVGGFRNETLNFKNAVTYNLVDGKIEKTKLKSDGEFKDEINKDVKVKKITLPQVRVGSIVEYSYVLNSPYISSLNDWYFQDNIPINYVEYNVYIPEYFRYRTVISGYENVEVENATINTGDFGQQKYGYKIKNVPSLKEEGYVTNIDNYTAILKYELASINYPNQPTKNFAVTWDDVVKSIYEHDGFGDQLDSKSYFEDDLKIILEGLVSEQEKIDTIFNFVKSKMTWNDSYGVVTDVGVKKAYKEKTGNVAEINLMLTAMLRYAGIQANPVLISTRRNGIAMFPNRTAYNYVVAGIEVQNDVLLLDATSKNAQVNLMPIRAVNWTGRIIRERGSSNEIDLLNVPPSKDNVIILGEIKEDGKVEGKLRRVLTDYNSFVHRENNIGVTEDSYLEKLENRYKGLSVEEYKVDNVKDLSKPIVETYSFTHDSDIEVIGNKMYVKPLLFFTLDENPFKLDQRKYPVDFSFPFKDAYNISIKIPEGYEVEYLPEAINAAMENNHSAFKYLVSAANNNIQLIVNLDVNSFYIPSEAYPALKDFFKLIVEKQTDRIILKKKE
ncbi:DUF3857 and transglutaminase domain-containing protein [Flavobacterium jejuense]|uniref:DUF3857 and transglutaminase domain-containing protein n=1 Tax=Flavobacterium jejuense TaxID=1544455 RepID=A0ABX0IW30_9FLAO|nr:DUF3857 domain-containing protein [Flavobacterium jejuense]NHN27663.1 DUF3857 and transglutaminase domain-containing protein [Flavobacterium jejuense]